MLCRNALCRDLSVKTIEEQRQTAEGDFIPTKVTSPGRAWQALLGARTHLSGALPLPSCVDNGARAAHPLQLHANGPPQLAQSAQR
jgi:hypothetical protein